MPLADRATIANMAPEYGATMRLLPGRRRDAALPARSPAATAAEVDLVERYCKEQGLFRTDATPEPVFTDTLELDLATVEPSLAGPEAAAGPRGARATMKDAFRKALTAPVKERGFGLAPRTSRRTAPVEVNGRQGRARATARS